MRTWSGTKAAVKETKGQTAFTGCSYSTRIPGPRAAEANEGGLHPIQ